MNKVYHFPDADAVPQTARNSQGVITEKNICTGYKNDLLLPHCIIDPRMEELLKATRFS